MERQVDQFGDSIRVEPNRGAVVKLVFERADGVAEHAGHFIHMKAMPDAPGI